RPGSGPRRLRSAVSAPSAVLVRPDGYVAWVGGGPQSGLVDALAAWFGAPLPSSAAAASPLRRPEPRRETA
ncbi:MAG: hypothetical protein V4617_12310, partial [Gemmatimonadota bacterium]